MVGKLGLEQSYEDQLRGVDGSQKMYVDNMGKVLEIIEKTDSVAGNDIYLTLDSDLQKYCYNALEKELSYILLERDDIQGERGYTYNGCVLGIL